MSEYMPRWVSLEEGKYLFRCEHTWGIGPKDPLHHRIQYTLFNLIYISIIHILRKTFAQTRQKILGQSSVEMV